MVKNGSGFGMVTKNKTTANLRHRERYLKGRYSHIGGGIAEVGGGGGVRGGEIGDDCEGKNIACF